MIESRRMRLVGYVARMGRYKMRTKFLSEFLRGRNRLEDLDVSERIILK